jgi:ribosomal protein S24E
MSVKDLKKKLNNILTKDESVVVSINGKWGVGKTQVTGENYRSVTNH